MPFSLFNAPATFQRSMNTILRDVLDRFVLVFLNNILVFGHIQEEHELHIYSVLEWPRSENFWAAFNIILINIAFINSTIFIRMRLNTWDLTWGLKG